MDKITIIEYKGRMYPFVKPSNIGTEKMFLDRCWFIVKNNDIENIESYADMWIAFKYYQSEYSKDNMEKIRHYEQNMRLIV